MSQIEILLIIFIINLFLIINFEKIKIFRIVIDTPDKIRKFHKKPTALAGGIILIINIFFYFVFSNLNENLIDNEIIFKKLDEINIFTFSCFLIFFLGIADDKFNLNPSKKFIFLFLILGLSMFFDGSLVVDTLKFSFLENTINLGSYSYIFTMFCFLVFINSFNMFDGINLQTSIYSFIILIYFFSLNHNSLLISVLIIFILFFMYLNHLNKSFFGDNGTLLVSFVLSVLFIKLFNAEKIIYSDEIFIYMMIPGIDMIRLFFERIKNKRNPFSYDRLHLHHLLLNKLQYPKTILIIFLLVTLPIILSEFNLNNLIIIFTTIIVYSFILIISKKNS